MTEKEIESIRNEQRACEEEIAVDRTGFKKILSEIDGQLDEIKERERLAEIKRQEEKNAPFFKRIGMNLRKILCK